MKTYPMEILREALFAVMDRDKYVRFTCYYPSRRWKELWVKLGKKEKSLHFRATKVKGKISHIWGNKDGLEIVFTHCYVNRKREGNLTIPVNSIRWQTIPFDEKKVEEYCSSLIKKLPPSNGRMIPLSASAEQLNEYI